jgi:hypothetical protein
MSGHHRRFLVENRRLVHIALFEAYTLTVFQVDGGDQQHSNRVLSGRKVEDRLAGNQAAARARPFR